MPRQTDHYSNEKLKKHRDGTPDHLRDGSLHPKSRRHLEELHVDVRSSRLGPPSPSHTWPRRPTSI
ncbi:Dihydrolipoamide acyltransferase [Giardia duodenalis assemblage B]|uniref:Dihydrolipoamide acyltransferase n=1 Tax=Giardia duodenalis assemblage B TaxID=1394984 RepID=A0A132NM80_GIAIN|nr:Dihydrolipoamide acyltransferase [Giardia intestinalis assemblage B]